jgi:hypothetical protein
MKRAALAAALCVATWCAEARAVRLVVLDDGEKVARDLSKALPPSAWPAKIDLFAMRGETIALQLVVEADDRPLSGVHASFSTFESRDGARLAPIVETFAERYITIPRPSGNDREPGSLAFTPEAAPPADLFVGAWADALVPGDVSAERGQRAALWVDVYVPTDARPGVYRSAVTVSSDEGAIASRDIELRVLSHELPYGAQKTMAYYDPLTLEKRMGDRSAERELRAILHAHHVAAFREIDDDKAIGADLDALTGRAFTPEQGYTGPGQGIGEGVFAIGAYGGLGEPKPEKVPVVEGFAQKLRESGAFDATQTFVYAIDETCESPWAGAWLDLLAGRASVRGVRVGVTCGWDPLAHRADLMIMTAPDYHPSRARVAKAAGKWVWAYNGRRPWSGAAVLDVPATDLRANSWIAARYDVDRWFYWETTYWLDNYGKGGKGGRDGFDPFEVAETFHNADGDRCNHDGILLYPGHQRTEGMVDYGVATLFPSVRLKNLRRGIEDVGYVRLARAVDREATDALLRRMVPRALALAGSRPSWPERGAAWLDARRELAKIIARPGASPGAAATEFEADAGCRVGPRGGQGGGVRDALLFSLLFVAFRMRRWRK